MRTNVRTGGLIALTIAAPVAAAIALFPNAPSQGGQFLSPAGLMAQAQTTEQDGMMGQGEMGGMGGMMNMMQQMSRMMATCNEMMEDHGHERAPGGAGEPETPAQ